MIISPSAISPYKIPTFQSGGGGFDPDALAFITAAGITGATQQAAIIQLVANLKGTGSTTNNTDVWSDIYAVYPMCPIDDVTATLEGYKWNLKDPRDLDAAFRITWVNTPVASVSLGIAQNGANNAYGNTYFIESANMVAGNNGATISLSQNTTGFNKYLFGTTVTTLFTHRGFTTAYSAASSGIFLQVINSLSIFSTSRLSATDYKLYVNGVSSAINNTSASTQSTGNCFILATNTGVVSSHFQGGASDFIAIHDGLTANKTQDITDAIATYKTALGR